MGVVPVATSTSYVGVGKPAVTMSNLMAQEEKERRAAQFKSKSFAWNEPMLLLQSMSSRKVDKAGSRSFHHKDGQQLHSHRPSKWSKFWRKLRFDGGKKVHAARPGWLNYDSQSYGMNFEEDVKTTPSYTPQRMPIISGPGAREIVTVLLTRSPTTNRNSGCILIPKPVLDVKQETDAPLWKRRGVSPPALLDVSMRHPGMMGRRMSASA